MKKANHKKILKQAYTAGQDDDYICDQVLEMASNACKELALGDDSSDEWVKIVSNYAAGALGTKRPYK